MEMRLRFTVFTRDSGEALLLLLLIIRDEVARLLKGENEIDIDDGELIFRTRCAVTLMEKAILKKHVSRA